MKPSATATYRHLSQLSSEEEQIRERLKVYHSQIDGITPFFKEVLTEVDGTGKPDEVFGLISEDLDKL